VVAPLGPEPPRRSGRSTALLVVVALVVALGAGGSVFALLKGGAGGGGQDDPKASTPASGATTPGQSASQTPTTDSGSPSSGATQGGTVPEAFLGTWDAAIDNTTGHHTRRLTIQQGGVGDTVLTVTADGSTYHCVFQAALAAAPGPGGPLEIGPSQVTVGEPPSCKPGAASEVTLLPDGRLRRAKTGSAAEAELTYTKTG
jgi:hypothetical protein